MPALWYMTAEGVAAVCTVHPTHLAVSYAPVDPFLACCEGFFLAFLAFAGLLLAVLRPWAFKPPGPWPAVVARLLFEVLWRLGAGSGLLSPLVIDSTSSKSSSDSMILSEWSSCELSAWVALRHAENDAAVKNHN